MKIVKKFEGNYNRIGVIAVAKEECTMCDRENIVLIMDGSEQEYYNGAICQTCANEIFDNEKNEKINIVEFYEQVRKYRNENPELRRGQILYNVLNEVNFILATEINNTDKDPFYASDNIGRFWEFLISRSKQ